MAITPNQIRLVDPFEFIITSNAINRQFSHIVNAKYGIVTGLDVIQIGALAIRITDGICVCDGTAIRLDQTELHLESTDYQENCWNVLVLEYTYQLNYPAPYATLNVLPVDSPDFHPDECVILAFLNIQIAIEEITYEHDQWFRSWNLLHRLVTLFPWQMTHDLDMHGYKVINLGDGIDDYDMVNKHQVDEAADNHPPLVKLKSYDIQESPLGEAMIAGTNISLDQIPITPYEYIVTINKIDEKVCITSGDETRSFIEV